VPRRPRQYTPAVLLDRLLEVLDVRTLVGRRDAVDVADLAYDSRRVTAGALFVCVPGAVVDGH